LDSLKERSFGVALFDAIVDDAIVDTLTRTGSLH